MSVTKSSPVFSELRSAFHCGRSFPNFSAASPPAAPTCAAVSDLPHCGLLSLPHGQNVLPPPAWCWETCLSLCQGDRPSQLAFLKMNKKPSASVTASEGLVRDRGPRTRTIRSPFQQVPARREARPSSAALSAGRAHICGFGVCPPGRRAVCVASAIPSCVTSAPVYVTVLRFAEPRLSRGAALGAEDRSRHPKK